MHPTYTDNQITRYLLGGLAEAERATLAEACVDDPAFFTRVAEIEDDLIDGYVRGKLDAPLRQQFEQHYLTHPARRHRVQLAKVFLPKLDQIAQVTSPTSLTIPHKEAPAGPKSPSFWQSLFPRFTIPALATILLFALGGGWLLYQTSRLRNELNEERTARANAEQRSRELQQQIIAQRQQGEELTAEIERLRNQSATVQPTPAPGGIAAFVTLLLPASRVMGSTPGTSPPTLALPAGVGQVRLQLNLPAGDYRSYRAVVQTAAGATIHQSMDIRPRIRQSTATFTIPVPTGKFASGEYLLSLSGIDASNEPDTLAKSLFRIEKK